MDGHKVDLAAWPRREYWNHYMNRVRCTYSMTANLDITDLLPELKARSLKLYAAQIYMLTRIVNRHEEFRYNTGPDGEPVLYDALIPSYTVFYADDQTFSSLWTPCGASFRAFHEAYLEDVRRCEEVRGLAGKPDQPENCFWISSIPWTHFTGFQLNIYGDGRDMSPIFTFGRYACENGRTLLPLSAQVHHAVCDGFHTARLFEEMQALCDGKDWLDR